jgi:endoglucanase
MIKKILLWLVAISLISVVVWLGWNRSPVIDPKTPKLQYLGILDSSSANWKNPRFEYLHAFIAWSSDVSDSLKIPLDHIAQSGKKLMITIEPWPNPGQSGSQMHEAIVKGEYDSRVQDLCKKIALSSDTPIVRWGHEMDLVGSTRYPWAITDTQLYIRSFQRVSTVCKKTAPSVLFMWSPAGIAKSAEYYPGSQYIDIIGLSIFGYPAYEQKNFGKNSSFDDVIAPRYQTVSQYKLPIMIAEMSVAGDSAYKQLWLNNCLEKLQSTSAYPLIRGFAYFDAPGVEAWESDIIPPNFDISALELNSILSRYNIGEKSNK